MTTTNSLGIVGATMAIATVAIPDCGRKVYYRGYLIHGEIPAICYAIYGRNEMGQLTELGAVRDFPAAMRWVDRHLAEMRQLLPVPVAGTSKLYAGTDGLPAAA